MSCYISWQNTKAIYQKKSFKISFRKFSNDTWKSWIYSKISPWVPLEILWIPVAYLLLAFSENTPLKWNIPSMFYEIVQEIS